MRILIFLFTSFFILADNHSSAEKEVLDRLASYYEARNNQDYKAAMSFESSLGTIGQGI